MGNSLLDDLKYQFRQKGDIITQLIIINVGMFVLIYSIQLFFVLFSPKYISVAQITVLRWLAVPANVNELIFKPWTLITYMFLHLDFFHILFNMLWLYWLGRILSGLVSNNKILAIYVLGGLAGAFLYILAYNGLPGLRGMLHGGVLLGASAGVFAIVFAAATMSPNFTIFLFILGPIRLKYIALFSILLDLISIANYSNTGGHIAHIGGALFGFFFIKQLQQGKDWSKGFNNILDGLTSIFKPKSKPETRTQRPATPDASVGAGRNKQPATRTQQNQEKIDAILDKIAAAGYDNLTQEEKDFLFRASKD